MRESTPKSAQPSFLLPPPASTTAPSILVLEWVVCHVPSSSRVEAKPAPLSKPPHPPRTTQPPVVFYIPMTAPNVAKGNAPNLSKFMARPPFELPIIADIPWSSRYEKGKFSSHVPSSLLSPSSQPVPKPFVPLTAPRVKQGRAPVVLNVVSL
ncbi:uncharacterized protein LOC131876268 [Cryptomeria japonica]|uniref:uncharacterized protein LOC131876268 n=1 Tax=Cryptomeria japonica TaxID=3369 RepID=UPI0027DA7053|nr:uncharacterized protein LOC131876268 [Cryptomeria japonica]